MYGLKTSRFSHFWTIQFHVLCFATVAMSNRESELNCYMKDDTLKDQKLCFNREGIDVVLPSMDGASQKDEPRADLLNSLIENEPEMVCRQKEAFTRALPCAMTQARKCMPSSYRDYLPNPDSMALAVETLCSNYTDVNFTCVRTMGKRLIECTFRKGKSAFTDYRQEITAKNVLCKVFELSIVCQKEVFPSCGCQSTQVYTDIYLDHIYPPACPPIDHIHGHVRCNRDGNFVTLNDLQPKQGANRHHSHPNNSNPTFPFIGLYSLLLCSILLNSPLRILFYFAL